MGGGAGERVSSAQSRLSIQRAFGARLEIANESSQEYCVPSISFRAH